MKFLTMTLFTILFSFTASAEIPYTKEALEKAQSKGERIMLQVYAEWCPVCKNEDKVFNNLKNDETFKSLTHIRASFDNDLQLKKDYQVVNPGTLILFDGKKEVGRVQQLPTEEDFKRFVKSFDAKK